MFCPLDCWDACKCEIKVPSSRFQVPRIKGEGFTPYLCYKLNNYFKFPRVTTAKIDGKNIMLSRALEKFVEILKNTEPKKVLFVKGSGNMGLMQNVTKLFFEKYGATFAVGSTCDGMGEDGINKGRGKSLILPTWIIKNAKNVIIWGRNPVVSNIHLLPLLKSKFTITIDVINTKTAKNSDIFIQVKPNSDFYLAILLSQMVIENDLIKRNDGVDFEKFRKIVFSYRKDELIKKCGINNENLMKLFEVIKEGAVVLTGLGIAKCKECYKTTWAIDSLFFMLDYFGKSDRGVAFLGSSGYGINDPFKINHKNKVALFDVNLRDYDAVFIQGANPLVSFVNRDKWKKLKNKNTIVFGKYYDETAKISTLFIPTKDFYEKKDIRGSYFHEYILKSSKVLSSKFEVLSEYELTKFLFEAFEFDGLKSEDEYLEEISKNVEWIDEEFGVNPAVNKIPYESGFLTKDKKFHFLSEDFEYKEKDFEIVTAKHSKALNSQFERDENIYINPKSKNIMLRWVKENIGMDKIVFDENIPENIVFAKGGAIINKFLKSKGENAYYEYL
ncbi:molybdopterin-dependent oxidoreductase [Caminibacter profundus]